MISRTVSSGEVAELLSSAGKLSTGDPLRPLLISWRAWRHDSGAVVFIEIGTPTASAAASTRGFIALYEPMR